MRSVAPLIASGDPIMRLARFEKVLERGTARKFFLQRIERDMFGNWSILVEKGRIGQSRRTVTRVFETEKKVCEDFIGLARKRLANGYSLVGYDLPCAMENRLLELEARAGQRASNAQRVDAALFEGFRRMLEILPNSPEAGKARQALRSMVLELNPQKKDHRAGTLDQFEFTEAEEERFPDCRREVMLFLAEHLLARDPWGRSAVKKALTIPKQIDGNVVSFIHRRALRARRIHDFYIEELFEAHAELQRLTDCLLDADIRHISQFLEIPRSELRERFGCSSGELQAVDMVLGDRRLNIGMSAA